MLVRLKQRGDTIVEVMIVLAVLGSAIGISYATANRSLLNARQAQENAEAARIAQAQVEALYTPSHITTVGNPNYLYKNRTFCMDSSGNVVASFPASVNGVTQRNIAYDGTAPGDYPAACTNGLYHYSIRYNLKDDGINYYPQNTTDSHANDRFTVVVVWDDALGQGKDTVTLNYRIHPWIDRNDL